ncbi:YqhR family membrane protein [Paenibacillus alkalitolerans]|uniref:YqhR family membrane protein n=1 Tax=Paenibacillus alkalitolerans TaxID=2799335 RepID=UPI001F23E4E3|nr:YqhR family membrane protein [Paenibacillus alkalitolerans]
MGKSADMVEAGHTTVEHTRKLPFALYLGFFAGVIWGAVRILFYFLRFTEVLPGFLAEPFFLHNFLAGVGGWMVGWVFWTVFSIIASLIYTFLFHWLKGPWYGVAYGLIWFVFWILLVGPWYEMAEPIGVISWNTLFTEGSLFALWGVFIGYSVAFEFTDERERDKGEGTMRLH